MENIPKYDVLIKSSAKDYVKLKYVINSLRFLNPQPSKIFLISPDGFKPNNTDYDNIIVTVMDKDVFPNCDRNNIQNFKPKSWCFASFIAVFQDVTEQKFYLDVQSDNFFIKPINLFNNNKPIFFISPQYKHFHKAYFNFSKQMSDIERIGGDSFMINFVMYNKDISKEMLMPYGNFDGYFKKACEIINDKCYPADQEIYPNWCLKTHNGLYDIQKNIIVKIMGKHYPQNYTEQEIENAINKIYNEEKAISLHTWAQI